MRRLMDSCDYARWLDEHARAIFNMSGPDFLIAYRRGRFVGDLRAKCLACVEPLLAIPLGSTGDSG
jgi:hypothetical protein